MTTHLGAGAAQAIEVRIILNLDRHQIIDLADLKRMRSFSVAFSPISLYQRQISLESFGYTTPFDVRSVTELSSERARPGSCTSSTTFRQR